MNIKSIYKKYSIPINLQEHMLRVGAIGSIICNSLKEITVDKSLIIKTLLLHDMGNILKFDFSKIDLLAEEDKLRVEELISTQKKFTSDYGRDTDEATLLIINEITSSSEIANLCRNSHWELAHEFLDEKQWDRKISCYSDMRIGPFGVIELNKRFDDLENRRPEEKNSLKILRQQGIKLEKQIQSAVSVDLQGITNDMIEKEIKSLENFYI